MLCKLCKAGKLSPRIPFLPLIILKPTLVVLVFLALMPAPIATAQVSNFAGPEGEISGTVLWEANKRPAGQVAVSLKSRVLGIFRSVLTDIEGHFRIPHLPHGTYEVAVEEEGYEAARTSTQLDGPSSKLVVYLRSAKLTQSQKTTYTVSMRELKIPGKAQSEFNKGLERLAKHDPAGSLSHFTKAAQAFPGYYEAHYHIGVAEMRLGHMEVAEKEYQEAIDLSGGHYSWADFGLGYLLCQQGKAEEAEKIIRRGLEVDDGSAEGYTILSDALMRQNRRDEAEKSAREALLRNPNMADAYLMLSNVDGDKKDYRAQLQDLDAYLKIAPHGPAVEQVQRGREVILRILAKTQPKD
jgi:tetratricopeptide (TPR) repeat protein